MAQQTEAIKQLSPDSIPTVVVNRKFFVNSRGLNANSTTNYINDYARVTAYLVGLDPNIKIENDKKSANEDKSKK